MPRIIYINPKRKAIIFFLLTISCLFFTVLIYKYANFYESKPATTLEKINFKPFGFLTGFVGAEPKPLLDKILAGLAQIDINDPKRMLAIQLLASTGKEEWYNTEPENEEIYIPLPPKKEVVPFIPPEAKTAGKPLIGIYATHNAETYLLSDGVEKLEGQNGGVMKAALRLKEELNDKGIGAVCDATIHDYPNWPQSYKNSLQTARRLLTKNPSIQILIDVHRDAMPSRESSVTKINGEKVARISFIVGSDTRSQHPNWKRNWAYANYLAEIMEKKYPGLLRNVRVQSGRYNQHVNTHSILIEVGSTKNTLTEAERAMSLFAEVMAESVDKR